MKRKLKIDELRVDTFALMPAAAGERGTVRANEGSQPGECFSNVWSCFLDASCGGSCDPTCVNTYECCM
jgi:hypothetical protein